MIILDTNIISELMRSSPSAKVTTYLGQHNATELFITAITIAEISYGINALPNGNRRRLLEEAFDKTVLTAFKHRILSFDEPAAHHYGKVMSQRKKLGRPMSLPDGQISAIARSHGATIATRNSRDFVECGIDIINPFE